MNSVLVLNQNYEPLAVARIGRALVLVERTKAEVLAHGVLPIMTPSCALPRPSVIRLVTMVKRPRPRVRFTRREVFSRDNHTCQYCGAKPRQLTIDHVVPTSRRGQDAWTNVVSSCARCNRQKGARTPKEAGMTIRQEPFEPRVSGYLRLSSSDVQPEWLPFLAGVA